MTDLFSQTYLPQNLLLNEALILREKRENISTVMLPFCLHIKTINSDFVIYIIGRIICIISVKFKVHELKLDQIIRFN